MNPTFPKFFLLISKLSVLIWLSSINSFSALVYWMSFYSEIENPALLYRLQNSLWLPLGFGFVSFILTILCFALYKYLSTQYKSKRKNVEKKRGKFGIILGCYVALTALAVVVFVVLTIKNGSKHGGIVGNTRIINTKDEMTRENFEEAINNYRISKGKTPLKTYEPLCALAEIRA